MDTNVPTADKTAFENNLNAFMIEIYDYCIGSSDYDLEAIKGEYMHASFRSFLTGKTFPKYAPEWKEMFINQHDHVIGLMDLVITFVKKNRKQLKQLAR